MATPTSFKGSGVKVDGLTETVKALGKVEKTYQKEAVQVFREAAADVQKRAQGNIGKVGRYPAKRGMIGRSATAKGAGVALNANRYPWALGAEYGEVVSNVPQHGDQWQTMELGQSQFKRRTMGVFKPPTTTDMFKNTGGYMVQPVLRARLPKIEIDVATRINVIMNKALRQAGVPGG